MEFLLIVLLTLLNALFAMSEMALAASRKSQLNALAEAGDPGARAALQLMAQPTRFLSTVQVGITSIGMLNGIVGEAAYSESVARLLHGLGLGERAGEVLATVLVVSLITFVTIVFGELVPKRIGQLYPETVARWMARPMRWLADASSPFVRLLSGTTAAILLLLRVDNSRLRTVTEAEISASLEEGVDAGLIEAQEHQMVQNVFDLDDRPLTSMMVPRGDIQWLDARLSVAQALRQLAQPSEHAAHSWYPVCRDGLDHVSGVVGVAQLLALARTRPEQPLGESTAPAIFVPETLSGMALLEQFRRRTARLVFVVDEYGEVQGLLTPHDLLEAITGELKPERADNAWATPRADGSWLLDGRMPVTELKARLDIRELPHEGRGRYNTLAGLLMAQAGHLPVTGERVDCAGWRFEVVDLDGRRIDKVLAQALPEAEAAADTSGAGI